MQFFICLVIACLITPLLLRPVRSRWARLAWLLAPSVVFFAMAAWLLLS